MSSDNRPKLEAPTVVAPDVHDDADELDEMLESFGEERPHYPKASVASSGRPAARYEAKARAVPAAQRTPPTPPVNVVIKKTTQGRGRTTRVVRSPWRKIKPWVFPAFLFVVGVIGALGGANVLRAARHGSGATNGMLSDPSADTKVIVAPADSASVTVGAPRQPPPLASDTSDGRRPSPGAHPSSNVIPRPSSNISLDL